MLCSQPMAIFLWPDKFDTFDIFKGIFLHAISQTCKILSFHKLLVNSFKELEREFCFQLEINRNQRIF